MEGDKRLFQLDGVGLEINQKGAVPFVDEEAEAALVVVVVVVEEGQLLSLRNQILY